MSVESKAKKAGANRAYKIRKKIAGGEAISSSDKTWLEEYDASKPQKGRKPEVTLEDIGASPPRLSPLKESTNDNDTSEIIDGDVPRGTDNVNGNERSDGSGDDTKRPPPDPPPQILGRGTNAKGSGGTTGSGDWRDKYRFQGSGREVTCREAAEQWAGFLKRLNKGIEANGGKPAFPDTVIDQALFPCMVLTVDRILPERFEMSPEVTAAVGSTVIVTQAYIASRKAKAKEREKEAEAKKGAAFVNERKIAQEPPKPKEPGEDAPQEVEVTRPNGKDYKLQPDDLV